MANGIPALLGQVANVSNIVNLVTADVVGVLGMFGPPQWGIFNQDGTIAVQPDSLISLDFKRDWKIPNYPQEEGSFQSYNKVALPSNTRIRLSKGGTDAQRAAFLTQVAGVAKSLTLFNVVMPEGPLIRNVNFTSYAISRTSTNGVGLISIDLDLEEVRVVATASFSSTSSPTAVSPPGTTLPPTLSSASPTPPLENTAAPSGSDPVSGGSVQAQPPTPAQDSSTNFVSGSANDATGPQQDQSTTLFTTPVDGAPVINAPTAADNQAAYTDRLNNPPPGLDDTQLANYKTGIATRYGITPSP